MTILPKIIYRFSVIPSTISRTFFTELEQIILKFIWNYKWSRNFKAFLKKKNKAGSTVLPGIHIYQTILYLWLKKEKTVGLFLLFCYYQISPSPPYQRPINSCLFHRVCFYVQCITAFLFLNKIDILKCKIN